MPSTVQLRDDYDAEQMRGLARRSRDPRQIRRLLALAAVYAGMSLRQNWLSNSVFEDYQAILDAGCDAWNKLIAKPETIMSIGLRDWAHAGQ